MVSDVVAIFEHASGNSKPSKVNIQCVCNSQCEVDDRV